MNNILRKKSNHKGIHAVINGEDLVSSFVTALYNRSVINAAKTGAKQSETEATYYLKNTPIGTNNSFITPRDIPSHMQEIIAKASMDAQLKKVQAEQISTKSAQQLYELELMARQKYIGKKVTLTILDNSLKPVQSFWQNSKTGKVTTGTIHKQTITGVIDDIVFDKNLLVLRPSRLSRAINPERKYITAYVVNPDTIEPMIALQIK